MTATSVRLVFKNRLDIYYISIFEMAEMRKCLSYRDKVEMTTHDHWNY